MNSCSQQLQIKIIQCGQHNQHCGHPQILHGGGKWCAACSEYGDFGDNI